MTHSAFFTPLSPSDVIKSLGKDALISALRKMLFIRNFEVRAETAYQMGKIGGFFHSYIGQEAVQTASVMAMGEDNWWITSYRCHALALLLGATANEVMAELYGKATGNAKGRGGSMHLYTERLLGGFGIVGGQIPIATGAAYTLKYQKDKSRVAVCYFGDGAVAQGAFHESLNLAALWDLPCIYVIENNLWGMGTAVNRALSTPELIAEVKAPSFGMKGYTLDGMDFFNCYGGFLTIANEVKKTQRPVLIEVKTQRFKGHSVSDPGLYRPKDELSASMQRDPILLLRNALIKENIITEDEYKALDKQLKEIVLASMEFADQSPWPDPATLEQDVYAP
ncbi:MAG: pyruvate dehydrogenase (acetyl-transferring) E1 component subunit alpha [Parachlamydiales bacterium]|nr:pyruvate dehydrogenase (acetyl-transferring) E1 component subunit alpha [Parachlamydiales bacterium]